MLHLLWEIFRKIKFVSAHSLLFLIVFKVIYIFTSGMQWFKVVSLLLKKKVLTMLYLLWEIFRKIRFVSTQFSSFFFIVFKVIHIYIWNAMIQDCSFFVKDSIFWGFFQVIRSEELGGLYSGMKASLFEVVASLVTTFSPF